MSKLLHLRPTLWVNNVRTTIDWYVQTLGFAETNYVEEWQWGEVMKDNIAIMFAQPNFSTTFENSQFTGSFYINTDAVDSWWEKLNDHPNVFYPIENFEYGMREFAIKDCNGYILLFGEELPDEKDSSLPA